MKVGFSFDVGRLGRCGPLGRSWHRLIGVGASVERDLSHTNAVARFAAHTLFMRAHVDLDDDVDYGDDDDNDVGR